MKRATRSETDGAPILGWLPLYQQTLTNSGPGIGENVPQFVQSVIKHQPSVTMANYLWELWRHCVTLPAKHHRTVKCWGEKIPISLYVVIFNSTLSNLTQKHSSSQLRRVLPNLSFNLDEGFVIVEVTIAIVTARLAAWKME